MQVCDACCRSAQKTKLILITLSFRRRPSHRSPMQFISAIKWIRNWNGVQILPNRFIYSNYARKTINNLSGYFWLRECCNTESLLICVRDSCRISPRKIYKLREKYFRRKIHVLRTVCIRLTRFLSPFWLSDHPTALHNFVFVFALFLLLAQCFFFHFAFYTCTNNPISIMDFSGRSASDAMQFVRACTSARRGKIANRRNKNKWLWIVFF